MAAYKMRKNERKGEGQKGRKIGKLGIQVYFEKEEAAGKRKNLKAKVWADCQKEPWWKRESFVGDLGWGREVLCCEGPRKENISFLKHQERG